MCITADGGYLLAGYSFSDSSGDKSEHSRGFFDYWIVKIDSNGSKLWDKTIGGDDYDYLKTIVATADGGYLLGGTSTSAIGADKSQSKHGRSDYWIVKIDSTGNKQWDRTVGSSYDPFYSIDKFQSMVLTPDGGCILGGSSNSDVGGDKTDTSRGIGYEDFWIVKWLTPLSKCGPEGCMDVTLNSNSSLLNPDAGNVLRPIRDLEIWGGVGEEPLAWMRYGNSQSGSYERNFGFGHNWTHTYQYDITDPGDDINGRHLLLIHYPEGEQNYFIKINGLWQPAFAGVNKQLFQNGNEFILQRANGFRYRFLKLTETTTFGDNIYYQLQDFRDTHQNLYKLTYNSDKSLDSIIEPAGRFIAIFHNPDGTISEVKTSDGRSVLYDYTSGQLTSVNYGDGTRAVYSYENGRLEHAIDPRYEGVATDINYTDRNAYSGFIQSIRNGTDTSKVLVSLDTTSTIKTLTYPNGRKQVFNMPPTQEGQIKSYTNGLGNKVEHEYADNGIGFEEKATDALGRSITYNRRTIYGNPLEITYPDGSKEIWTRDSLDLVFTHKNQLNQTTTYTRDSKHRVTRIDYYDGSFETFTYNIYSQVIDHVRPNGGKEHSEYSSTGLQTGFTNADSITTTYTYDAADRLKTVKDGRNNITTTEYNERGLVTKMINPGGSYQEYKYDNFGNRTKVINELGKTSATDFDVFGRPTKMTDPLNRSTLYAYELPPYTETKPTKITEPSGKTTTKAYDLEWNIIRETVGAGSADEASTSYQYNILGNLVTTVDPRGKVWLKTYDVMNRIESETNPFGNKTSYKYDPAGRIKTEIRPDNGTTKYDYDDINRIIKTTDPKNQEIKQELNAEGNLVKLIDAKTNNYIYEYDKLNRKTKMIYPDNTSEKYEYDASSNLINFTNRAGNKQTIQYDNRNRDTASVWDDPITPAISKTYDNANRVLSLSSAVSALSYTYSNANEFTSETQVIAGTAAKAVNYTYNEDGLPKTLKYPNGNVITYDYTGRDQIALIKEDGQFLAGYKYDLSGNRTGKDLKNNTSVKYTTDAANRKLTVDNLKACVPFSRFDYGYDNLNRRKFTQRNNDKGDVFVYDAVDQLTGINYDVANPDGSPGTPAKTLNYSLDAAGNRISVSDNGIATNYTTNNLNQYTQAGGASLGYTPNGSLQTWNGWTYTYDAQNRMTKAVKADTAVKFAYDPANRCVKRTVNDTASFLYYEGWNLIEERNAADSLQARYTHGANTDEILAKVSAGNTVYYHHDALGNVVGLTNNTGDAVEQYTYDVFGTPTIKDGSGNSIAASAFGNRFMFTGRELIKETGLYDYRNRMYTAKLGRFMQTDPIGFNGGDVNIYRYVSNNVVNTTDPLGLTDFTDEAGVTCSDDDTKTVSVRVDKPKQSVKDYIVEHGLSLKDHTEIPSGHTYLVVDEKRFGFYPTGGWFGKPGSVKIGDSHKYTHYKDYKVCPETLKKIQGKINTDAQSPPIYNITDLQCTTWALGVLKNAGIKVPTVAEPFDLANEAGFVEHHY